MDELDELYGEISDRVSPLLEREEPLAIAAILVTLGLGLYKTLLNQEDYTRMTDAIYSLRDNVKSFNSTKERTLN